MSGAKAESGVSTMAGRAVDAQPAPVALFAYARPGHLQRTVNSLQNNAESRATHLHVFCDAAKRPEHQADVAAVRRYVESISGFASVTRVYRDRNLGLANSIIQGVDAVLRDAGRVIVIEDDLLLSPHFLRYMNDGLALYQNDSRVASIHGYSYPTDASLPETFFLTGADCWGWATWSRAWAHFEADGERLMKALTARGLLSEFDFDGAYPYSRMLGDQIAGRNDSWAIRWHAACYLADLLTLYPGRSLVHNIGNDASGTHGERSEAFARELAEDPVVVRRLPLVPSGEARSAFAQFFRTRQQRTGRLGRWVRRLCGSEVVQ